ncbi:MAG: NADH-quinone oxidoreductase subunit NuoE [Arsenophonus sp. ET-DL9-MAG3]
MQDNFNSNQKQKQFCSNKALKSHTKYKFVLTGKERKKINQEKKHYEDPRSASIEALKIVQKKRGWIEDGAIYAISDLLGISASDVEGVATFYSQIYRQPVGRHIIRYCDSIVCYITGYQDVEVEIIKLLNIEPGKTTEDGCFTLLPTCCLGNCHKSPTIMIDEDTHSYVNASNIQQLLERYQ